LVDEPVKCRPVLALDALLELRVDVHRHLRVGVADLAHDPQHVEAVGQQRDRDVRATQRVRRRPRQGRQPARDEPFGRKAGGITHDLADALAREAAAAGVLEGVGLGVRPRRTTRR
jgi:hypothetical protein